MAKFNYGGQAVIEGVMMRGRHTAAVALRAPGGGVLVREEALDPRIYAGKVARWPFVRGLILLWDMLVLGTRTMMFAATVSVQGLADDHEQAVQRQPGLDAQPGVVADAAPPAARDGTGLAFTITVLFSIAFAVGLFFVLPLVAVSAVSRWLGDGWLSLVAEGVVRLALLIGYLYFIGRFASVQRVFEYHGAEHKAINAYEAGKPLDVEHVRAASRVHTRCGTGFLLIVVVLSIFVFALLGAGHPSALIRVLSRIVLVPVIAAIAYELMRLGATYYRYRVVRWLMAPSLALQGLTTREPDAGQMECAIVALQRVLRADGVPELERVA